MTRLVRRLTARAWGWAWGWAEAEDFCPGVKENLSNTRVEGVRRTGKVDAEELQRVVRDAV